MSLAKKLKLLFAVRKPLGDVTVAFVAAKKDRKWLAFAVTVVGSLLSIVLTMQGFMPPEAHTILSSFLQALYNFMRGLSKSESPTVKGPLATTEVWMSGIQELQKAVVASQAGGVQAPWVEILGSGLNTASLIISQYFSALTPAVTKEPLIGEPEVKNG